MPDYPPTLRLRFQECEALAHSLLGETEAALAASRNAVERMGAERVRPGPRSPHLARLHAETLILHGDLLAWAGRAGAARDAWDRAAAAAREAGGEGSGLLEEVLGR